MCWIYPQWKKLGAINKRLYRHRGEKSGAEERVKASPVDLEVGPTEVLVK